MVGLRRELICAIVELEKTVHVEIKCEFFIAFLGSFKAIIILVGEPDSGYVRQQLLCVHNCQVAQKRQTAQHCGPGVHGTKRQEI